VREDEFLGGAFERCPLERFRRAVDDEESPWLRVVEGDHLGGVEVDQAVYEIRRVLDQAERHEAASGVFGRSGKGLVQLGAQGLLELGGVDLAGRDRTVELVAAHGLHHLRELRNLRGKQVRGARGGEGEDPDSETGRAPHSRQGSMGWPSRPRSRNPTRVSFFR
jgi:hypothetical protein